MLSRTEWFDLPVSDLADAMSFYEGLLEWKYRQMEDSPLSDYAMIEVGGSLIGGLRRVSKSPAPAGENCAPILYFTVAKLATAVARAKELGAQVVENSVNLGKERGCYQWIRDRSGNMIGLWGPE